MGENGDIHGNLFSISVRFYTKSQDNKQLIECNRFSAIEGLMP